MKRVLFVVLLVAAVGFFGCQKAEARGGRRHREEVVVDDSANVVGVKLDAPNLIELGKGFTLGAEGGKDIINDLFGDNDVLRGNRGYFAYVKVTYSGCLLNCKEE